MSEDSTFTGTEPWLVWARVMCLNPQCRWYREPKVETADTDDKRAMAFVYNWYMKHAECESCHQASLHYASLSPYEGMTLSVVAASGYCEECGYLAHRPAFDPTTHGNLLPELQRFVKLWKDGCPQCGSPHVITHTLPD